MKNTRGRIKWLMLGPLIIFFGILMEGCKTSGSHPAQTRGVYTTLENPASPLLASSNFPASGWPRQSSFGPRQTPVAVITGYGGCRVTLEVVELATGQSSGREFNIAPGKVAIQVVTVNKSGDYQLRLRNNGVERDTFKFSVTREGQMTEDYDAIITMMDADLKRDPQDAYSYRSRAHAYEAKRNFARAISDYTQALWLLPNDTTLLFSRAQAFYAQGDLEAAIKDLSEFIRTNPDNSSAYNLRASAYGRKGDWNSSISDYSELLRRNPDVTSLYIWRGQGYSQKGDFDNAIKDLTEAIRRNPGDTSAFYDRGYVQVKKGDFEKAVSDLREAIHRNPQLGKAYNELAWVLASCPADNVRDGKAAVQAASVACGLDWKNARWIDTLAAAYAETGDFENAIKYENMALSLPAAIGTNPAKMRQRLSLYEQHQPYREPVR